MDYDHSPKDFLRIFFFLSYSVIIFLNFLFLHHSNFFGYKMLKLRFAYDFYSHFHSHARKIYIIFVLCLYITIIDSIRANFFFSALCRPQIWTTNQRAGFWPWPGKRCISCKGLILLGDFFWFEVHFSKMTRTLVVKTFCSNKKTRRGRKASW